jgi:hypothetical protein
MRLQNAQLFFDGKPVGEVKSFSMRESDSALPVDAIRKAFEEGRDVWWRGYKGTLVELNLTTQRDGTQKVTKLEGVFQSPVTGGAVTVPVPPGEVRLAP